MMSERLDTALTALGLAPSREKARALIIAGSVYVNGAKADKPSHKVIESDDIALKGPAIPYVSRGGLKLEKALGEFGIELNGKRCLDIGASTGGFTDCMLKKGAQSVTAVDVGYGQLDWTLRNDQRVTVLERTNARYLTPEMTGGKAGFASIDVSFISLSLIFPAVKRCLENDAGLVALIKPQFEAGREHVGKKGVVRSIEVHESVIKSVTASAEALGFSPVSLSFSPVTGPEGNIEFLLYAINRQGERNIDNKTISSVVETAHRTLCC